MIQDVDEALRVLVRREALPGTDVDVAFDAPTREWSSRRNAPTLDLYLYDIREDLHRRETTWRTIRDDAGFVVDRRPPPRHYKLSYLVTAWTQRPEDEHRLLSAVLSCFVRHERLPDDVLSGALVGELPIIATIALPPPSDRPLSDIWSALGGELKPSLDLVIVAPLFDSRVQVEVPAPPVLEVPLIGMAPAGPVGARRGDGEDGDEEGGGEREVAGGKRRRMVASQATTPEEAAAEKAAAAAAEAAAAEERARLLAKEAVESGTHGRPGRTIRLRIKK